MKDFFSFRRMITPYIIMIIFWASIVLLIIGLIAETIAVITIGAQNNGQDFLLLLCCIWPIGLPVGILVIRIYCELLILFFRMNETLTDIKNSLRRQQNL